MNLLKIFTYGGIIEVFVVPHILPCVMGFIPSHINDMIQLGISLVSSLFPHITINVQSEVFLKVWKDGGGDAPADQLEHALPSVPDFKSDMTSDSSSGGGGSSGGSTPRSDSPDAGPTTTQSKNCPSSCLPSSAGPSSQSRDTAGGRCGKPASVGQQPPSRTDDNKNGGSSGGSCPNPCQRFSKAVCAAQRTIVSDSSDSPHSSQKYQQHCAYVSNASSSELSERSELFARSCSAEYRLRPTPADEWVDLGLSGGCAAAAATAEFCSACSAEDRVNEERQRPSFAKSCSLEYATVLEASAAAENMPVEVTRTSVGDVERLQMAASGVALNRASNVVEPVTKWKSCHKFSDMVVYDKVIGVAAKKSLTSAAYMDEPKPIYFGDNFQNL